MGYSAIYLDGFDSGGSFAIDMARSCDQYFPAEQRAEVPEMVRDCGLPPYGRRAQSHNKSDNFDTDISGTSTTVSRRLIAESHHVLSNALENVIGVRSFRRDRYCRASWSVSQALDFDKQHE